MDNECKHPKCDRWTEPGENYCSNDCKEDHEERIELNKLTSNPKQSHPSFFSFCNIVPKPIGSHAFWIWLGRWLLIWIVAILLGFALGCFARVLSMIGV